MKTIVAYIKSIACPRFLPWLALAGIFGAFVVAIVRLHPANFFGYTEDDSIYFSSAKALAEGKGYVLPSFPGAPAATKYPIFYPWILSWVWRWNPSFPANLTGAIGISVAFGLMFLTIAFLFLRRLKGISYGEALLLTAFLALHPLVLYFSGSVLSEFPFAAFALSAMLLAETAVQREASISVVVCCGILVGLAMLTRVFGVPIAIGIVAASISRRAWRQLAVFCACVGPFSLALLWRAVFPRLSPAPVSAAAASSLGWIQTWTYYTSYISAWKVAVPNISVFLAMLKYNAMSLLCTPAGYFAAPSPKNMAGCVVTLIVTAAIFGGIVREARGRGYKPIHWILPFYAFLTLMWNYPSDDRFFIPFMPLFAAGIWIEGKNLAALVRRTILASRPVTEKVLATSFGLLLFASVLAGAVNYVGGIRTVIAEKNRRRGDLLQEKREVYQWLSRYTARDARVVAYEDGSLYLYSNRVVTRPISLTTAEFHEPARLRGVLDHITDVPRAIDAAYWVSSDDDFGGEWQEAFDEGHARMRELEGVLPLVYRSSYDHVRVYSLDCIQHPESLSCESARDVLFPEDRENAIVGTNLR